LTHCVEYVQPENFVLYGYTSRAALGVVATGDGGYAHLASELESRGGEILFGAFQFVRDGSHKAYCFISWIGPEVSVVKRGRAVSATLEVAHFSLLTSHLNL
jgi:hypothetical protein